MNVPASKSTWCKEGYLRLGGQVDDDGLLVGHSDLP